MTDDEKVQALAAGFRDVIQRVMGDELTANSAPITPAAPTAPGGGTDYFAMLPTGDYEEGESSASKINNASGPVVTGAEGNYFDMLPQE